VDNGHHVAVTGRTVCACLPVGSGRLLARVRGGLWETTGYIRLPQNPKNDSPLIDRHIAQRYRIVSAHESAEAQTASAHPELVDAKELGGTGQYCHACDYDVCAFGRKTANQTAVFDRQLPRACQEFS